MSGRDGRIGWFEDMKAGEKWPLLSKKHKPTQRKEKGNTEYSGNIEED